MNNQPIEVWKTIPGHEGRYSASNLGRVRKDWDSPLSRYRRGAIIRQGINTKGYAYVGLVPKKGTGVATQVHALVAAAFFGPRPTGLQVNHKNGKRADNRLENLEYVTGSENCLHAYRVLGRERMTGEKHPNSILSEKDVADIHRRRESGSSVGKIARSLGVCRATVSHVLNGRNWKHAMPH